MIDRNNGPSINRPAVYERYPSQSQEHYKRSLRDPLRFAYPTANERQQMALEDEHGLEAASRLGKRLEIIDFASDLATLDFLEDTGRTEEHALQALEVGKKVLEKYDLNPARKLSIEGKMLSMATLLNLDRYQSAMAKLRTPEDKKSARALLEASTVQIIMQGAKFLFSAAETLEVLKESKREADIKSRENLIGDMFELLFATIRRLEILRDEAYDKRVVVGTSAFQDKPVVDYSPSHNYDFIEIAADGTVDRIVQCKAKKSEEKYAEPIVKVCGKNISRFFRNPKPFIEALDIIIQNPDDPRYEKHIKAARELLDSLFESNEQLAGQTLGGIATQKLVTV